MAWHKAPRGEVHTEVLAAAQSLSSAYESRRNTWREALKLYLDREISLSEIDSYDACPAEWPDRKGRNLVASVVETVHSHCVTMSPRPSFRTVGNSAEMQDKVKTLQRVVDAQFQRADVERAAERACLDALIGGDGWLRVAAEDGEAICERVAPYRVLLEPSECVLRRALTYYCVSHYDADALAELYPKATDAVLDAGPILAQAGNGQGAAADDGGQVVEVIEAIRLPAMRNGVGRRIVFTAAGVLEDKPYRYFEPPYYSLLWLINPESPYGVGLPERLAGTQEDSDRREEVIRDHEQAVAGMWLLPDKCGISVGQLDNKIKTLTYNPALGKPDYVFPSAVAPDVYASQDRSEQAAFRFSGVSQLAATGENRQGVTSGVALRRIDAIASRRFAMFYKSYQNMFVWVGRMFASMIAREPSLRRGKLLVSAGRGMSQVHVRDARVDPDMVDVRVRVSSFNATSPPELLQELNDYYNGGMFTREQVIRLTQTQDLEAEYDLLTAPQDLIDARLEAMLDGGAFAPPEDFFDHQLCLTRGVLYYQLAELRGRSAAQLQMIRDWIRASLDLMGLTQGQYPGQPPPMPAAPGAPPAPPGPPGMPGAPAPPMGGPMPGAGPMMPPSPAAVPLGAA